MVDNNPNLYLKTVSLVRKYFSEGQPLAREKEVFDAIVKSRGLTEQSARKILQEVQKHVGSADKKKLEIKKNNLIKEIHHTFGQDFFDVHRIPEYRLYASIQTLIEQYRNNESHLNEGIQKIQLEEALVKFMTSQPTHLLEGTKGEKVDGLVATLAMRKFEERYSGSLTESQKKTLRRFMNFSMTGNEVQFRREMTEEKAHLLEGLAKVRDLACFSDDKVMGQRMDEALKSLKELTDLTSESSVQELLLFHKLLQEINSNE